jgi:hypothetical protein
MCGLSSISEQNHITHLYFVDDFMMFCHADLGFVRILRGVLDIFSRLSGLTINQDKSFVYSSGVDINP